MKTPLTILLLLIFGNELLSQGAGATNLSTEGLTLYEIGIAFSYHQTSSLIEGVDETIIRSELFDPSLYSTKAQKRTGSAFSIALPVQLHKYLYVQPQFSYQSSNSDSNSDFNYTDVNGLEYDIWLNYNFVGFGGEIGASVPFFSGNNPDGFLHNGWTANLGFGYQTSKNISKDEVVYQSNDPLTGPDSQIQTDLSRVLTGRNLSNFYFASRLSHKFLFVEFIYDFENSDVLKTEANAYNFIENDNARTNAWRLGIGLRIPIVSRRNYSVKSYQILPSIQFVDPFTRKYF